jgi:RNA polymerase sigma-70 factor (ECF subfamily)
MVDYNWSEIIMPDLVEQWLSGDSGAFESLFRQYEKLVFRTAYLITGDAEIAGDIMQEVFISVWKSRHTFNPRIAKFTTWLHRITVNKCSKKHGRKKPVSVSLEDAESKGLQMPHNSELPEEILISKEEYGNLMKALNSLDVKHRSILVLRFFNELSLDEIAMVAEIPLGTVKSRLHYALKSLRSILIEENKRYGL